MSSYLQHYGIKGMKWGVRRSREELGYRTYSAQKGDITLQKGHTFQRIATNSNSGYTKGVYTSYKSVDKDLYKGVLGRMRVSYLHKAGEDINLNEITMKARKDIHIPSKEVRIDQFKKLTESDPVGVQKLIEEHESGHHNNKRISYTKDYIDRNTATAYEKFNDALALGTNSKNGKVISAYYRNLSKLGYDAVPDENDIRLSSFKAQAPIILFNTNQSIGQVNSRKLDASEVYSAYVRSIGKVSARRVLEPGSIGFEKLQPDTQKKANQYARQLEMDKHRLNKDYSIQDLAKDWGEHRLSTSQISRVSSKMDEGMSHDDALANVVGLGNSVTDFVLDRFGL